MLTSCTGADAEHSQSDKHRGVNLVWRHDVTKANMDTLAIHHVEWISLTPFGYQQQYDAPEIRLTNEGTWGETDHGLAETARLARETGIKTMLKPHVWLLDRRDGKLRSDIEFPSEKSWQLWFENYNAFMLHYAQLAASHNTAILCIGTELANPAITHEAEWRELIAAIREIYDGKLTYAANWYEEFEHIAFWDDLDFIGIQGYFPLSDQPTPSVEDLILGWQPHKARIEAISKKFEKPVVFTEQGYKSTKDTAMEPWNWPETYDHKDIDFQTQANCYEAFFRTFWHEPWVAGVYWWRWGTDPEPFEGSWDRLFTPQSKPAAEVLRTWFGDEKPE
ncbi:MAG: hypothetical protein HKN21_12275 [Candidatus Eisenbacteria bacterium]|uniref:GTA TIM-barrel-like domain-containing protein n=1 Tax=Eiseniibacteriota bacterium TaxID=2212470 RepID=A0A7Y2E962_UNCEI|nr:hypothetical protein [Candidatus Eisenbacteria bacterium]